MEHIFYSAAPVTLKYTQSPTREVKFPTPHLSSSSIPPLPKPRRGALSPTLIHSSTTALPKMARSNRRCYPPPIRNTDPRRHTQSRACGPSAVSSSHSGSSSSRGGCSRFPDLPPPLQRKYLAVRQRRWGTWIAEITDCETHEKISIGSFH